MASLAGLQGKAAVHAAEKKAEGLLKPLLESVESDEESDDGSWDSTAGAVSVEVKRTPAQKLKMALVSVGLGAGVAASAAAMILNQVATVFVMGAIAIVNAPYAAFKEHRITKLPALRALNNKLKEEANDLEDGVDFLSDEIENNLKPSAARATEVEAELKEIAADQQFNVDKFVLLVKENETIIAQMKDNVRQRIVQDVLKIVLSSDKNNDGQFGDAETKLLVLKISLQLQEYGVEFDEGKFVKVMGSRPSVQKTVAIVKRLIPDLREDDDGPEEDEEDEETTELYDMFHMSSSEGTLGGSIMGSISGPVMGGSMGESTMSGSTVHSALGGPQKLSLSITKDPSRSQSARKRDRFKQKFDHWRDRTSDIA